MYRTRADASTNEPVLDVHPVLTLLPEPPSLAVRSDGGQSSEGFGEMGVNGRPQDGIQSFQLSRARPIVQRNGVVHKYKNGDGDEEIWNDDSDQHEGANDTGKSHQEHPHRIRDGIVDGVDVFGEPVHDPSDGGGLEVAHGSAHDGSDCHAMEGSRGGVGEETDGRTGCKERDGQGDSQAGIDAHLKRYVSAGDSGKRGGGEITYVESRRLVELVFLPVHEPITGHDLSTLQEHERKEENGDHDVSSSGGEVSPVDLPSDGTNVSFFILHDRFALLVLFSECGDGLSSFVAFPFSLFLDFLSEFISIFLLFVLLL